MAKSKFKINKLAVSIVVIVVLSCLCLIFISNNTIGTEKSKTTKNIEQSQLLLPGVEWSQPDRATLTLVLNNSTPEESYVTVNGQKLTSKVQGDISSKVYDFYNSLAKTNDYTEHYGLEEPSDLKNWVRTYSSNNKLIEIQMYEVNSEQYEIKVIQGEY